jgi:hypothetical protein
MLLQKLFIVNWIDDNHQHQKYTFWLLEKANSEIERLKIDGFDTWLTTETISIPFSKSDKKSNLL